MQDCGFFSDCRERSCAESDGYLPGVADGVFKATTATIGSMAFEDEISANEIARYQPVGLSDLHVLRTS